MTQFEPLGSDYIQDVTGKMDPEVKERWITALRSGEYKQTRHLLKNDGCYCCLGVLAEIKGVPYGAVKDDHRDIDVSEGFIFPNDYQEARTEDLPSGFCGLSDLTQAALASLNDEEFASFNDIAIIIERNL